MYDVIIIGGGASGILSAIKLSSNAKSVLILEHADKIGKKLLATGNGKCNLLNDNITNTSYNCQTAYNVLENFPPDKLIDYFYSLGIPTYADSLGRRYPVSNSSHSVLDILTQKLLTNNVDIKCSQTVTDIGLQNNIYTIQTNTASYNSKNVILACGSPATFGKDSLELATKLGHTKTPFRPSLCPIKVKNAKLKNFKNLRLDAVGYYGDYSEKGQLQFKDDGVSGIMVFNFSELINRKICHDMRFDLCPNISRPELVNFLKSNHSLTALFPPQIADNFTNITSNKQLAELIKNYTLLPNELYPIKHAQLCHGGLSTDEFSDRLESLFSKGLFVTGEALNVSGLSGGYNLMWAFASALTSANAILLV